MNTIEEIQKNFKRDIGDMLIAALAYEKINKGKEYCMDNHDTKTFVRIRDWIMRKLCARRFPAHDVTAVKKIHNKIQILLSRWIVFKKQTDYNKGYGWLERKNRDTKRKNMIREIDENFCVRLDRTYDSDRSSRKRSRDRSIKRKKSRERKNRNRSQSREKDCKKPRREDEKCHKPKIAHLRNSYDDESHSQRSSTAKSLESTASHSPKSLKSKAKTIVGKGKITPKESWENALIKQEPKDGEEKQKKIEITPCKNAYKANSASEFFLTESDYSQNSNIQTFLNRCESSGDFANSTVIETENENEESSMTASNAFGGIFDRSPESFSPEKMIEIEGKMKEIHDKDSCEYLSDISEDSSVMLVEFNQKEQVQIQDITQSKQKEKQMMIENTNEVNLNKITEENDDGIDYSPNAQFWKNKFGEAV